MMKKETSRWWLFDSHQTLSSPWLRSTLAELEKKAKSMLRLIEQDADSFAQRAEMYYKKRPELINMVEDLYRMHRSLAENYDLIKPDSGRRVRSPFANARPEKVSSIACPMSYDHEEGAESEVDDPDTVGTRTESEDEEEMAMELAMIELRKEIEGIKKENVLLRNQLAEKDEEKREVIRQLTSSMEFIKTENIKLQMLLYHKAPQRRLWR